MLTILPVVSGCVNSILPCVSNLDFFLSNLNLFISGLKEGVVSPFTLVFDTPNCSFTAVVCVPILGLTIGVPSVELILLSNVDPLV